MNILPQRRRRKFTCHYCGNAQFISVSGPIRQFLCTSPYCEAVNHIDEYGNIIDYVPEEVSEEPSTPTLRYARSRKSPQPETASSSPIFCSTCEKNMYYKERLLAEYLPAEDHESYQSYLETLPVYQERLERDYPAPCETCAVKVNNKIREVNYAAKAATIGRFLEQSQSMKLSKMASGWSFGRTTTLVMWLLRGTGWMSTHIVMILWHISAVLYPIPLSSVHEISGTWNGCVKQTLANSKIAWECYETSTLTLLKLVPWSVLFIFWNYQGLNQTAHPEAKLTGITVFWKLDLLVYCFRLGAWAILAPGGMELSKRAFMATHISFLVVFVLAFVKSLTCLKLVDPPRIYFRESASPMPTSPAVSPPPLQRPTFTNLRPPQAPSFAPSVTKSPPPMNMPRQSTQPAKQPIQPRYRQPRTPSPPRRQNTGEDEMDWNPTTPALEKVLKQPIIANHRDSPFAYGPRTPRSSLYQKHKPELSLGGSQTLPRNISKETFFSFREQDLDENDMSPLKQEDPMQPGDYEPMAKPRLFIPDEDTGLESLMGSTLKLEDMPDLVRAANALKNTHGPERRRDPVGVVVRFAVLLACFGGFVYLSTLSPLVTLSSPSAIFLERETNTIDNHMDTPSRTPKHIIYAKLLTLLVAGSCITWKLLEKKAAETIASANTPSTEWTIEKLVLAIEAMSGFLLSIYRMSQRNVVLVGRVNMEKLYLGWVLLRAGYDCIVLLQEGQVSKPIRPPVPQLHQRDRPSTASATSASTILPARAQSPAFVSRPISPSPIPMRKSVSDLGSYGSNNSTPIQGRSSGFSRATPTGRGPAAMFNIPNLPLPGGLPPQQGPGRNGLGATGPLITGNRRRTGGAGGQQQGSGGGGGGFSGLRL